VYDASGKVLIVQLKEFRKTEAGWSVLILASDYPFWEGYLGKI
jgi:hypothetical protein